LDKKIILLILLVAVASSLGTVYAGISGTNVIFRTSDGIADHEVMRITSDGKVGIGTTTPQSTLDVNGDGVFSGTITSPTITDLRCANFNRYVDLHGCDLQNLDLSNLDLRNANLIDANLSGAYLAFANLNLANLIDANLSGATLNNANLSSATLNNANINSANLSSANLSDAFLIGANLNGAFLHFANFDGANLTGITYVGCFGSPTGTPSAGTLPVCTPIP
jgi:uncharacterized protein YjbI with pentapeptide repeats